MGLACVSRHRSACSVAHSERPFGSRNATPERQRQELQASWLKAKGGQKGETHRFCRNPAKAPCCAHTTPARRNTHHNNEHMREKQRMKGAWREAT
jgi:hypothetical protein